MWLTMLKHSSAATCMVPVGAGALIEQLPDSLAFPPRELDYVIGKINEYRAMYTRVLMGGHNHIKLATPTKTELPHP